MHECLIPPQVIKLRRRVFVKGYLQTRSKYYFIVVVCAVEVGRSLCIIFFSKSIIYSASIYISLLHCRLIMSRPYELTFTSEAYETAERAKSQIVREIEPLKTLLQTRLRSGQTLSRREWFNTAERHGYNNGIADLVWQKYMETKHLN